MLSNTEKKWFILYTRLRWEKKVLDWLNRKKIECYCPFNEITYHLGRQEKVTFEPLFPCNVFVRITDPTKFLLRFGDGIISYMHWMDKPVFIKDEEFQIICEFINGHKNVQIEKITVAVQASIHLFGESQINQKEQVVTFTKKNMKLAWPGLGYVLSAKAEQLADKIEVFPNRLV